MVFIHDHSCECAKSVHLTKTSIEYDIYIEYHPMSSITDWGPIEFDVSSSGQNYLDFSNSQLLIKDKLNRGNGVDITYTDHVGGVNLFQQSVPASGRLIKRCSSQPVVRNVRLSAIHWINPQLRTPSKILSTYCRIVLQEHCRNMDRPNPAHGNEEKNNVRLQNRASFTDEGATVDMTGRINLDVFFQDHVKWS